MEHSWTPYDPAAPLPEMQSEEAAQAYLAQFPDAGPPVNTGHMYPQPGQYPGQPLPQWAPPAVQAAPPGWPAPTPAAWQGPAPQWAPPPPVQAAPPGLPQPPPGWAYGPDGHLVPQR